MPIFCSFLSLLFHLGCTLRKFYLLTSTPCWVFSIHLLPPRAITQVRWKPLQNNLCLLFFSCHMVVLLLLLLTSPGGRHWRPGLLVAPSPFIHHTASQWAPPEFCLCVLAQSDSGPASPATAQESPSEFCTTIFFLQWVCVCCSVSKPGAGV